MLHDLAARSTAISARLSASLVPLKPRSHILYSTSTLKFPRDGFDRPTNFFLRRNLLAFQNRATLFILTLDASGGIERLARLDLKQPERYIIAYQLSDDKNSLVVATVEENMSEDAELQVLEVCVTANEFGKITHHLKVATPYVNVDCLVIRDPFIALVNYSRCRVMDWRKKTGINLEIVNPVGSAWQPGDEVVFLDFLDVSEVFLFVSEPLSHQCQHIEALCFHPREPILVVSEHCESQIDKLGIYWVDIPSDMPEVTLIPWEGWNVRRIRPNEFPRGSLPLPDDFFGVIRPSGFRTLPDSSWVLDLSISGSFNHGLRDDEQSVLYQVTLAYPEWTLRTKLLSYSLTESEGSELNPFGTRAGAATEFFALTKSDRCQVVTPKFDNRDGHDPCWVRLILPEHLKTKTSPEPYAIPDANGDYWKGKPCIFDVHSGRLFIGLHEGLLALQY